MFLGAAVSVLDRRSPSLGVFIFSTQLSLNKDHIFLFSPEHWDTVSRGEEEAFLT